MDYVIRGGSILDGTGRAAYQADIGIKDGMIAAIEPTIDAPAAKVIDAAGHLVTPGFIDVHTHFDGQATWDDGLEPSASHGVTTVVMGNCGVGFAPMRLADRDVLIDLMEGVEDIPGTALTEGIPAGQWESFAEYLDFLDKRSYALDISAQVAHGPLRFYVMGDRGARNEDATAEDIAQMAVLTQEAMEAGAVGLSTSRTVFHSSISNEPVPGTFASEEELLALTNAVKASKRGIVQAILSGSIGTAGGAIADESEPRAETRLFAEISKKTGVTVTFTVAENPDDIEWWRDVLAITKEENGKGASLRPMVAPRAIMFLQGLTIYHLFMNRPTYKAMAHLPLAERVAKMRAADVKATILAEKDDPMADQVQAVMHFFRRGFEFSNMFPMTEPVDYEPHPSESIAAMIERTGIDGEDLLYDLLLKDEGQAIYMHLAANYFHGDLAATHEMLVDENSVIGLSDAGAHVTLICDGSNTTFALSHWSTRRSRGPRIPLEELVAKLTAKNADLYQFADRGRLLPGLRADINVIDLDVLAVKPPRIVKDLPAGGSRLVQDAQGYLATFVAGRMTRFRDEDTGERPGRLVRSVAQ